MDAEEHLIAEQVISLRDEQYLTVRISQHQVEEFWRVDVTASRSARGHVSTTVSPGDSFMMHLIEDAVSGQQVAWQHLAQWGRANLSRPASGPRSLSA